MYMAQTVTLLNSKEDCTCISPKQIHSQLFDPNSYIHNNLTWKSEPTVLCPKQVNLYLFYKRINIYPHPCGPNKYTHNYMTQKECTHNSKEADSGSCRWSQPAPELVLAHPSVIKTIANFISCVETGLNMYAHVAPSKLYTPTYFLSKDLHSCTVSLVQTGTPAHLHSNLMLLFWLTC